MRCVLVYSKRLRDIIYCDFIIKQYEILNYNYSIIIKIKGQIKLLFKIRKVVGNTLVDVENIDEINLDYECILSIDGSTDITGMAIIRRRDKEVQYFLQFEREGTQENPVAFKVKMKKEITKLLLNNKITIRYVYYEEPYFGFAPASKNLMMLRTFIEEIKFENEEDLKNLIYTEINNNKWKRLFLYPEVISNNTELDKKAVRDKIEYLYPYAKELTQDEIDAFAMGLVAVTELEDGNKESLKSKKKSRGFQYNIEFIASDYKDIVLEEVLDSKIVPREVMMNGIAFIDGNTRKNFDQLIYENMEDDDKLLIIEFNSNRHGNIILKHNIGYLAADNDILFALVWRKTRKRKKS